MDVNKENKILKELLSFTTNEWDLTIQENEGIQGTTMGEMKDLGISKESQDYFKKNHMFKKTKRMKVLLANLPWEEGFNRFSRWSSKSVSGTYSEPLLLAYATAVLERDTNVEVKLGDFLAEGGGWDGFEKYVQIQRPDLIIIETSTPSFDNDKKIFDIVKRYGSKLMMVGTHPSVFPKELLEKYPVDVVAIGEFDYTVRDVVNNLDNLEKVKGIGFKKDGKVIITQPRELIQNLDDLPFPARHHLPMRKYRETNTTRTPFVRMLSSRGCYGRCIFCVWNQVLFNRQFRARSPKNVIKEMEFLLDDYKVKYIYIDDDTFTIDKQRVLDICDLMIEKGIHKKIRWGTLSRVNSIDLEMLERMKKSGCDMIVYGVESGSQKILNNMKKGITLKQIRETIKNTKKVGIRIHATFMFGAPGETKETIRQTIDFAKELNPDTAQFPICMPYPGTEFYNMCVDNGWLVKLFVDDWSDFYSATNKAVVKYDNLTPEDLEEAVKTAYKEFYFRPKYIMRKFFSIRSFSEFKENIKSALSLLKSVGDKK